MFAPEEEIDIADFSAMAAISQAASMP